MTETNAFQKPTFDARIEFYRELFDILKQSRIFATIGELQGWYRSLHLVANKVMPYIEPTNRELLNQMLIELDKKITRYNSGSFSTRNAKNHYEITIDRDLMLLDKQIHYYARMLMLPLENLNTGEFDTDRFMRESDLAG